MKSFNELSLSRMIIVLCFLAVIIIAIIVPLLPNISGGDRAGALIGGIAFCISAAMLTAAAAVGS